MHSLRSICFVHSFLIAYFCLIIGIALPSLAGSQPALDLKKTIVLTPDYTNPSYTQVAIPIPGLTIVSVNDLRTGDAGALAATAIGYLANNAHLLLSEAVTNFVQKSFETMLGDDTETQKQREIILNIEELWLDHDKTSALNNHLDFTARIAVAIVYAGDTVKTGYLQNRQEADVPGNVKDHQAGLLYQGMANMARQLARKMMPEKVTLEEDVEPRMKPIENPDLVKSSSVTYFEAEPFSGASLVVHVFTHDLMKDSYSALVGGRYYGGHWFKNHMGYRAFLDFSGASGTPQRVNSDWVVSSSDIKMSILSLGGTYLYCLRGDPTKTIFIPFVGAGFEGIFGAEKLSARATRNIFEEFEGDVWSLRAAFAVHAMLATRIRVTDQWRFVLEARWTQSGKGSNLDIVDEEEKEAFQATLYQAVRRSDFDFTGWSIHAGLEW